jgi:hypothetical protein
MHLLNSCAQLVPGGRLVDDHLIWQTAARVSGGCCRVILAIFFLKGPWSCFFWIEMSSFLMQREDKLEKIDDHTYNRLTFEEQVFQVTRL